MERPLVKYVKEPRHVAAAVAITFRHGLIVKSPYLLYVYFEQQPMAGGYLLQLLKL